MKWTKEKMDKAVAYIPSVVTYALVEPAESEKRYCCLTKCKVPSIDKLDKYSEGRSHATKDFNLTTEAALTCKFKVTGKWVDVRDFENKCGYKPHKQKDSEAELRKAIANTILEFKNVPTSGFKALGYCFEDEVEGCVVALEDPRGFQVIINNEDYFELLWLSGKKDLDNLKLIYVFFENSWKLTTLDSAIAKSAIIEAECKPLLETIKQKTGKLELEVGKIYDFKQNRVTEQQHRWLYLGTRECYGPGAVTHFYAGNWYKYHRYDLEEMQQADLGWLTTVTQQVVKYEEKQQDETFVWEDKNGMHVPWLNADYKKCIEDLKASRKLLHVFYDVGDASVELTFDGCKSAYDLLYLESDRTLYYFDQHVKKVSGTGKAGCQGLSADQSLTYRVKIKYSAKTAIEMTADAEEIKKRVMTRFDAEEKDIDRFWQKLYPIEKPSDCAAWQRYLERNGYKKSSRW